ncbi:50S ribosomal protein L10 [Candidatus Peregrinibacteria bacterium]|nr:50S ribosomal protein L10 [Candidatus Peregrinibacteria bacterium]
MPLTRANKQALIVDIAERLKKASSVIFSDYRGLTVKDMNALRHLLREKGMEMKIIKKTFIRLAAKNAGISEPDDAALEGPISVTFSYSDPISPAKILHTFSQAHEALQIRGGFMDGKILKREEVNALAVLPSKEELLTRLVWTFNAPISGFYTVIRGTLSGFMNVLSALSVIPDRKVA